MSNKNTITDSFAKSKNLTLVKRFFRRDEFFQALKKVYYDQNSENLPIYGVVCHLVCLTRIVAIQIAEGLCNIKERHEEGL